MDRIIFALKRAYLTTRRAMDEGLAPYDMNVAKLEILICLHHDNGMEQRTLQGRIGITSASLTSILDTLEAQRLIQRRVNDEDARVKQVYLTQDGETLLAELQSIEEAAFMATFFKGFSAAERVILTEWLEKIGDNMA